MSSGPSAFILAAPCPTSASSPFRASKQPQYVTALVDAIHSSNLFDVLSEDNLDTAVAHLQSTIIAAAKATFGTPKPRLSPRPAPPPWFDNECRTARKLYRRADKSLGATPTATRLRAAYKKLCRSKKATYIAAESDRLLEQARTDPHTFYKNLCPRVTAPR